MLLPKISIVIPSHNQGIYLEQALQSVINESYPNLELFVVDGGSTDNTLDVIKKYEPYINWWVSEKDSGQSEAINKGFGRATGHIVTWLCSDDVYTPGTLSKVARYFLQMDKSVGLIHGGITVLENEAPVKNSWGYGNPSIERNMAGMAFSQPAAFFLRKYLDKVGGSVNEKLHYGMDYDLFSRLACVCNFVPVKDIFAKYRLHHQSKSVVKSHEFIGDWSRTFVNLCNNVGWNDLNDKLRKAGVINDVVFDWHYDFNFAANPDILKAVDKEQLVFYHLCYIFKDLYWTGQRDKARAMLEWMKTQYSFEQIKREENILPIIKKLAMPDALLRVFKGLNRIKKKVIAASL